MKLPMETVMKLPIQDRRYFIHKHNEEQRNIRSELERNSGTHKASDGDTLNEYARLEQNSIKNRNGGR